MLNEMGVLASLRCGQHLRILQDKKFPIVACIPKVLPYAEHKDVNTLHAWPAHHYVSLIPHFEVFLWNVIFLLRPSLSHTLKVHA